MHQYLKQEKKEIQTISSYCPLDLFSCNESRIRRALQNLFHEPQNNIKIYLDSQLQFAGNLTKTNDNEALLQRLQDALQQCFPSQQPIEALIDILVKLLLTEPLLQNLKRIQEMDELDIEIIWQLYQKLLELEPTLDFNRLDQAPPFSLFNQAYLSTLTPGR
jgi:inositol-pentakisphosphate 2-kinase